MSDGIARLTNNGWVVTFHKPPGAEQVSCSCEYGQGNPVDGSEQYGGFGDTPDAALSDVMQQMYRGSFEGGAY